MKESIQPDKAKIEYIGPKILVIVRIPEIWSHDFEKDFESAANVLSDYYFIIVRQSDINQIEFEYPKNYISVNNKPTTILNSKSMSDAEKEGLLKAFNTK